MKTIIVYYGYTNHTKMIAEKIKDKLECDILEIKPKVPYSNNYQKVVDETEDNLETRKTPEIKPININLDEYDKVIIGSPVWWYTITPPIRTFLKRFNLAGKKVYAYATNAGWLGSTFDEIKELCKGKLISTISIKFDTDNENQLLTNEKEIEKWIDSIKKE